MLLLNLWCNLMCKSLYATIEMLLYLYNMNCMFGNNINNYEKYKKYSNSHQEDCEISVKPFFNVATLALGSWPRQGFAKVRAKSEARKCGRMGKNEPPHSQVSSHFGSLNPNGFPNFQRIILGVQTHWIEDYLHHWKALGT
jgi:hypothetical protein